MRPVILLPDGAASWPAERLRVALLHELAHIKRGDWATQTAARLVCALFWHNPLVWPAARTLRAEAERACDDLVLSSGVPAPDYAQHLLAVAAALSGAARPLPLAVPMAGRGPLESRLRAVLSPRPRRALSRPRTAFAFVSALFVLVPLAAVRPAARAAHRVVRPLPLTPAVTPPRAVRPFSMPIKAAVAAPPVLTPAQSTPIGVPPMRTLTPVKTVALAALAASLALPAVKAQAPIPSVAIPAASTTAAQPSVSPPRAGALYPVSFAVDRAPVRDVLAMMFKQEHLNYVLEPGISGTVNLHLSGVPFGIALTTLLAANSQPLDCIVEYDPARGDVYHIQPRIAVTGAREAVPATPRQVQIKFEWIASAGTPGAPDKSADTLIVIAEEGRRTQASSQHLRNGVGRQETITVLARLKAGGLVTLDITEHSDTTARPGETISSSSQTVVSVKDGETGAVGGMTLSSQASGQGTQTMLFVTPSIIRRADGDPSTSPVPPPQPGGTVNPFTIPTPALKK